MSQQSEGLAGVAQTLEPGILRTEQHVGLGYRELTHRELLERAAQQAADRKLTDVYIVDTDFHQSEDANWDEILDYLDDDVLHHMLRTNGRGTAWIPADVATGRIQDLAGRMRPNVQWSEERKVAPGAAAEAALIREALDGFSIDFVNIFSQRLLDLGTNRFPELEVHLAHAYARWLTERLLPEDKRFGAMLYLPWSDPEACMSLIDDFADKPGVIGFMITSVRYEATHARPYMKVYRALEERDLPLGFHAGFSYYEPSMAMFNSFLSVHAMGFPHFNMVHATNWVINGLPERFPDLDVFFVEGGLAWIPFLMQRLDHTYMMRPSEAPRLTRLPSEYMREFYYSTQPMEATSVRELKTTLEMINAPSQIVYASDWPHWDWDPPSRIWDLPFLSEDEKRGILGENGRRLFRLDR